MSAVIGAALVMTGCTAVGILAIKGLNDRAKALWHMVSALEYMEAEIEHGLTPLPEILRKQFGGKNAVTSEISLNDRWRKAIQKLPLKRDEMESLEELGLYLGRFGQEAAISRTCERMRTAYDNAVKERGAKGKLYGFMGVGLGVMIVLMLV